MYLTGVIAQKTMKKQNINVLSIDFDWCQNITSHDIIYFYPDPHDFPTEISTMIWQMHYIPPTGTELLKIKNDKNKVNFIKSLLEQNNDSDKIHPNMIVNSHKHIYDFIKNNSQSNDNINIYNFDMHHDMFKEQMDQLTCSNWGLKIKEIRPDTKIIWIKNTISDDLYPSDTPDEQTTDYSFVTNINFDMIFLCRSDHYVPPHLDKDFIKLTNVIKKNFVSTWIEKGISKKRKISKNLTLTIV